MTSFNGRLPCTPFLRNKAVLIFDTRISDCPPAAGWELPVCPVLQTAARASRMVNYPTVSEGYAISQSGVDAPVIWIDGEDLCRYANQLTGGINTVSCDAIDRSI